MKDGLEATLGQSLWPTLVKYALSYVKKYVACQRLGNAPQEHASALTSLNQEESHSKWKKRRKMGKELPTVLWSLRSTPNQATGEAPFSLVYGTGAVLPAEVGFPTYRQAGFDEEKNDQRLKELLNFTNELRDEAL
ncbi:hypothetical protein LIER_37832 [Lithospermum erythrorhizon]|uniref:Uncharacterized protein n=1 Tax=Lithospermum erythrorhizon TaxID=34254 RepID=A0AAV3PR96_LITER